MVRIPPRLLSIEDDLVAVVPEARRWRARIAVRAALALAPWGFVYAVFFYAFGLTGSAIGLVLAGVTVGATPIVLRIARSERVAGHLLAAGLTQCLVWPTWVAGGLESASIPWLAFSVILATVTSGRSAAMLWTSVNLAVICGLFALQLGGHVPPKAVGPNIIALLAATTHVGFFVVVGVLALVSTSVVERQREALADAHRTALEASQAKTGFLARMSHELRTPMNAIIGYTELVQEDAGEAVQPDLKRIHHSSVHLLGLIDDILDLTKVEAGELEIQIQPVSARAVAEAVFEQAAPLLAARGNRSDILGDAMVHADPQRLRQCLVNLVANATKFTRDGCISVRIEGDADWTSVAVVDEGIGMSPSDARKVFDPFFQAQHDRGGTGLGLSIVKQLMERMGGGVAVDSELGRGSTFTLTLPTA